MVKSDEKKNLEIISGFMPYENFRIFVGSDALAGNSIYDSICKWKSQKRFDFNLIASILSNHEFGHDSNIPWKVDSKITMSLKKGGGLRIVDNAKNKTKNK